MPVLMITVEDNIKEMCFKYQSESRILDDRIYLTK